MRIGSSIIKHLALACLLGACQFDSKATGPGTAQNPQSGDGSVAGAEAQPGTGGTAAVSGDAAAGSGGDPAQAGQGGEEAPPPLLADGVECNVDERCQSGHCNAGICCAEGYDCCKRPADCTPDGGDQGKACDDHQNCNGTAGKVTCDSQFRCITIDGAPNDSACDATVKANDCGAYKPVYCNGEEVQDIAPDCPTSCTTDDDCDEDAHCDGQCIPDAPTGEACDEPGDCQSSTCGMNGICCGASQTGGEPVDCCSTANDCPAKYKWEARCDSEPTCQGTVGEAKCNAGVCETTMVENDGACDGTTECGLYKPVTCMRGRSNQPDRGCSMTCMVDSDCNAEAAFCQNSRCTERLDDGVPCERDAQCKTGCGDNKICCNGETCCASVNDCPKGDGTCTESCANGKRKVVECAQHICVERSTTVDDDTTCSGMSFNCGYYDDVTCTDAAQQEDECLTSCDNDADCDENAACTSPNGGTFVCGARPMGGAGPSGGSGMPDGGND